MTIEIQPGARLGRRSFLALAGAAAASSTFAAPAIAQNRPPLGLMRLPYDEAALAPVISGNTVSFHYGKHHRGYVDTVNRLVQNDPLESASPRRADQDHLGQSQPRGHLQCRGADLES